MPNTFNIQLVGVLITAAGAFALIIVLSLYGRPLTRDERIEMGEEQRGLYRIPINMETIVSGVIFLAGIGILTWSKFNLCAFLTHWLNGLPMAIRLALSCR